MLDPNQRTGVEVKRVLAGLFEKGSYVCLSHTSRNRKQIPVFDFCVFVVSDDLQRFRLTWRLSKCRSQNLVAREGAMDRLAQPRRINASLKRDCSLESEREVRASCMLPEVSLAR
jgi:hypothetical protein